MEDSFVSLGAAASAVVATVPPPDEFSAWRAALANKTKVEFIPGSPSSGFYRLRTRNPDRSIRWDAVAIWREDGLLCCDRVGARSPTDADSIEELFSQCNSWPISYELFQHVAAGGAWPEDVGPVEVSGDLPADEALKAELVALRDKAKSWLAEIGAVKTKEDADKSANFADAFAKLEKRATELHKAEKAPHLDAGRAVDAKYKPLIEDAGLCKSWAKKAAEAYLIAEKRRIAEEEAARKLAEAKAAAEAERLRKEAEAAGAPPVALASPQAPWPPQAPEKAAAGTAGRRISVRTRTVHRINDMRAVLEFLAKLNDHPRELIDAVQLIVNRSRAAGVAIPGVETVQEEYAA